MYWSLMPWTLVGYLVDQLYRFIRNRCARRTSSWLVEMV